MFGISRAEFIVIWLVTIMVIPTRYWPDVARALAKVVKFIRSIIWKITDASEKIKEQIEMEAPIDDIINTTTKDVLDTISIKKPVKKRKGKK